MVLLDSHSADDLAICRKQTSPIAGAPLEWQERLLSDAVTALDMQTAASHLTRQHYDEVVAERVDAMHLCGYPFCANPYSKRKISRFRRTVRGADVAAEETTADSQFCAAHCQKASAAYRQQLVEEQLPTSSTRTTLLPVVPGKSHVDRDPGCMQRWRDDVQRVKEERDHCRRFAKVAAEQQAGREERPSAMTTNHRKWDSMVEELEREMVAVRRERSVVKERVRETIIDTGETGKRSGRHVRFADESENGDLHDDVLASRIQDLRIEERKEDEQPSLIPRISREAMNNDGNDDDDDDDIIDDHSDTTMDEDDLLPSLRSFRQVADSMHSQLSLFQRMWVLVSGMVTQETRRFVVAGASGDWYCTAHVGDDTDSEDMDHGMDEMAMETSATMNDTHISSTSSAISSSQPHDPSHNIRRELALQQLLRRIPLVLERLGVRTETPVYAMTQAVGGMLRTCRLRNTTLVGATEELTVLCMLVLRGLHRHLPQLANELTNDEEIGHKMKALLEEELGLSMDRFVLLEGLLK